LIQPEFEQPLDPDARQIAALGKRRLARVEQPERGRVPLGAPVAVALHRVEVGLAARERAGRGKGLERGLAVAERPGAARAVEVQVQIARARGERGVEAGERGGEVALPQRDHAAQRVVAGEVGVFGLGALDALGRISIERLRGPVGVAVAQQHRGEAEMVDRRCLGRRDAGERQHQHKRAHRHPPRVKAKRMVCSTPETVCGRPW
jgi:hypothetical protein